MILINEDQLDCGFSKFNTKWNQIHANKIMLPHDIIRKNLQHYLAHVIEQPNFRIPNPQYFVYLLDQIVGRDILQFIYWNHTTFSSSF